MQEIDQQKINRLDGMLSEATNIAIVTHMKPDGDALGSSIAMHSFLAMTGKKSKVILPHAQPSNLDFLSDGSTCGDIITHEQDPAAAEAATAAADLIICLDFNAFHRTDRLEGALKESKAAKVLIDHHLSPDTEQFDLIFSETEVSSASELLYHILMKMPQIRNDASALPPKAREALMTGMTTDTNNFGNSVYPTTLQMASALLAAGTDRDRILSMLFNRFSESRLRLMGHMMKDLLTVTEDGVAYMILDSSTLKKYNVKEGDTEGFVNMPLSIENVRMSILVKEDEGRSRVSVRSKKGVSANRCARLHFNGGGHENAAGGKLRIPEDIACISDAAGYIERHTHKFMTEENEE